MLAGLWLLDPLPGWNPSRSALTRLQEAPKHHLADPALAARLLGATHDSLLEAAADLSHLETGRCSEPCLSPWPA